MVLRYRHNRLFVVLFGVTLVMTGLFFSRSAAQARTSGGSGAMESLPFRPGERYVYKLHWGIIQAGLAELTVMPAAELDGVPVWHFRLSVRTNEFVDVFYKVRDKIESFVATSMQESLLYRKSQREGRSVREEEVRFDNEKHLAIYSNHGQSAPPISLMAGTIDPLAAIFYVRTQPLREGLQIVRPITDGKKNVLGVSRVVGRQKLEVNGVEYDTFKVEPDLKNVGGVFEKSDKSRITLWFTADERRLLLKIEGKVVVGAFTGTLSEFTAYPLPPRE